MTTRALLIAVSFLTAYGLTFMLDRALQDWNPRFLARRWARAIVFVMIGGLGVWVSLRLTELPPPADEDAVLYYEGGEWVLSDLDGRNREKLAMPRDGVSSIAWSPDGRQVIFGWREKMDVHAGLYVFDVEDRTVEEFLAMADLDLGDPAWAPDGSLIAFTAATNRDLAESPRSIYTVTPDRRRIEQVSRPEENADRPAFSTDSQRLIYEADLDNDGFSHIYSVSLEGSDRLQITTAEGDSECECSEYQASAYSDGRVAPSVSMMCWTPTAYDLV
jgi:Tol biopolymer transport system component